MNELIEIIDKRIEKVKGLIKENENLIEVLNREIKALEKSKINIKNKTNGSKKRR